MTDAQLFRALCVYVGKVTLVGLALFIAAGWLCSRERVRQLIWWPGRKGSESHG
jgi:hypothetical protein